MHSEGPHIAEAEQNRALAKDINGILAENMNPVPTPYTLHPTPYTLHPTPYTLHPTPYTLHPTPYTLHTTPCTLHPTPHTHGIRTENMNAVPILSLHKHCTLNPTCYANPLNPELHKHCTLNPKRYAKPLNP